MIDDEAPTRFPPPEEAACLADLLRRIAAGDPEALAAFYDATASRVFGLASVLLRDEGLAEEATVRVYDAIRREAGSHEASRRPPLDWALDRARSHCKELMASRSRRPSTASSREARRRPHSRTRPGRELDRIPHAPREVLEMAYFGGLSPRETARALGLSEATVRAHLRTALDLLRRSLAHRDLGTRK